MAQLMQGRKSELSFKGIEETEKLFIMDVAEGIERVQLLEDLNKLETMHPISGHDFDLAMELKMLQKVEKIGKIKIIAIPLTTANRLLAINPHCSSNKSTVPPVFHQSPHPCTSHLYTP